MTGGKGDNGLPKGKLAGWAESPRVPPESVCVVHGGTRCARPTLHGPRNPIMPVPFTCPHCGKQTSVAEEFVGCSGACAECGKKISVPRPGEAIPEPRAWPSVLGVFVLVAILVALATQFLPELFVHGPMRRNTCANNLHQVGLALISYEAKYRRFPAAASAEKEGQPPISWRVEILPYFERTDLWNLYDRKHPWNSPRTKQSPIYVSVCYIARAIPMRSKGGRQVTLCSWALGRSAGCPIRTGISTTSPHIRHVRHDPRRRGADSGIQWAEPRDLTVDEFIERLKSGKRLNHPGGVVVTFCDGHVMFLRADISPKSSAPWPIRTATNRSTRACGNDRRSWQHVRNRSQAACPRFGVEGRFSLCESSAALAERKATVVECLDGRRPLARLAQFPGVGYTDARSPRPGGGVMKGPDCQRVQAAL